jgi:hypothetical protein
MMSAVSAVQTGRHDKPHATGSIAGPILADMEDWKVEVRSCCVFKAAEEGGKPQHAPGLRPCNRRPFRNQTALVISKALAFGLRQMGYKISEPRHGKACDAIFRGTLPGIVITVVINSQESRNSRDTEYRLLTWRRSSPLGGLLPWGGRLAPEDKTEWRKFCLAIDRQLKELTYTRNATWLTRRDAERLWSSPADNAATDGSFPN